MMFRPWVSLNELLANALSARISVVSDCLIQEMLFIRKRKPKLGTQSDSIRAKVFISQMKKPKPCITL